MRLLLLSLRDLSELFFSHIYITKGKSKT